MAYTYKYINQLVQFDYTNITIVLTDDSGIMPEIRNDKSYLNSKYPDLTFDFLDSEAKKDIEIYTQRYLDDQISLQEE